MAAKVMLYKGAWWLDVHFSGTRHKQRFGPTKADQKAAKASAEQINAKIALGEYKAKGHRGDSFALDLRLRDWHTTYSPTFKPSYNNTADRLIENHLVPYFGSKDLRDVTREDVLGYIRHRLSKGSSVSTIQNGLTIVRRVFNLEMERPDPIVTHNPAAKIGKLLKQVSDATAEEVEEVDAWSREEVKTLLGVAREHDPRFYPALVFLFSTGCRRGECLGLKWEDVHFDEGRIKIRRALVRGAVTVPKGRKSRYVTMPPTLASLLLDLLGQRRRACLARGWAEVPEWVFCSETGGLLGERNFERSWGRVRRRAQKQGVRPLRLHAARHTFASLALGGWQEHQVDCGAAGAREPRADTSRVQPPHPGQ